MIALIPRAFRPRRTTRPAPAATAAPAAPTCPHRPEQLTARPVPLSRTWVQTCRCGEEWELEP